MSLPSWSFSLLGAGLAALVGPCAGISPSNLTSSAAGAVSAAPQYARESSRCESAAKQEVVIQEERAVGGSLAVRFVAETGGLLLKSPSSDTASLKDPLQVNVPKSPISELNRYVNEVGKLVAAQSSRPGLPWTFAVMETQDINAFSTPGGYVLVSRGLLAQVENEAQLAGLLGHEIAHITERHHVRAYQKHKLNVCQSVAAYHVAQAAGVSPTSLLASAVPIPSDLQGPLWTAMNGMSANGGVLNLDAADGPVMKVLIDGFAVNLLGAGFAREQELSADQVGFELAARAGYKASELQKLLHKLPKGSGIFAKHPPPEERAAALDTWSAGLAADSFEHAALANANVVLPHPKELKAAGTK